MARMVTKLHNVTCPYGHKCCAMVHSNGTHATPSRKRARRALKRRDRQSAKLTLVNSPDIV